MWFENAIGKEKIQFMFKNELDIKSIEVDSFSLERFSDLKFIFFCKHVPKTHPEKWGKVKFNALKIEITFGDVIQMNVSGTRVGFICSPMIKSSNNYSEIKIQHDSLELYCKAKFLTIEGIYPYVDERWD